MAIHSSEPLRYVEPIVTSSVSTNGITSSAQHRSLLLKRSGSSPTGVPLYSVEIPEAVTEEDPSERNDLLRDFVNAHKELESYKSGSKLLSVSGSSLSLPLINFAARFPELAAPSLVASAANYVIDTSPANVEKIEKSRKIIDDKLENHKSIYGVSTGFGGSADTRTDAYSHLGLALLQHQHAGVLPTDLWKSAEEKMKETVPLPLSTPISTLSMPIPWVRAALLVRLNSLVRGHSAISLSLLKAMSSLLAANITPVVPLRSSISASGDLSPLSYIAGTLIGEPGIFVYSPDPSTRVKRIVPAPQALKEHGLQAVELKPKEHLGILNGTAFSCGLAALCVEQAREMMLWSVACTALGVEAMRGTSGSFDEFIHRIRPHPGQRESARLLMHVLEPSRLATHAHEEEGSIEDDAGVLRQDRYPLRTAPQWLGPQMEALQAASKSVAIEANSTTDNPLIDPETGRVHHGGNFQAMSVTMAMENLRLSLVHVGKLLFSQATELQNPLMNGGLTGNLASTDPSVNFFGKGLDIAMASYVGELCFLGNPVSTGVQSAEMHNQAVNSLAFISARYTQQALDILQILTASYLYLLCQAVDLRAFQIKFQAAVSSVVTSTIKQYYPHLTSAEKEKLAKEVNRAVWATYDGSPNMDAAPRMEKTARASTQPLVDYFLPTPEYLSVLPKFQTTLSEKLFERHQEMTAAFLKPTGKDVEFELPAAGLLGRTSAIYTYIRRDLGVRMHGAENFSRFEGGLGAPETTAENGRTIGHNVSTIYEAIRDGKMTNILVGMFEGVVGA